MLYLYCIYPMTSRGRGGAITEILITSRHHFRSFDALNHSEIFRPVHSLMSLSLTTPSSAAIHCSLQDSLWETRRPQRMAIPFKLPSFDSYKQVFVWANCMLDPVAYLLICDVLCIRYFEQSSIASHLYCKCPAFACIQEDRYHERTSDLEPSSLIIAPKYLNFRTSSRVFRLFGRPWSCRC